MEVWCSVRRWHWYIDRDRKGELYSAADASISSSGAEEEPETPAVFPRIRERDPYRLLGLSREATFEEIQDARNFYYDVFSPNWLVWIGVWCRLIEVMILVEKRSRWRLIQC